MELGRLSVMKLSDCGDCSRKSTCLIPNENKTWLQSEPVDNTALKIAVEVIRAFNRAGINYKIKVNGKIDFHTAAEKERAIKIIQAI